MASNAIRDRCCCEGYSLRVRTVEFDSSILHGIKLTGGGISEIFSVATKELQDEWLNSFINAGATYREAFNVDVENVKSVYELKDFDMQGNEVGMDKYKGKVLLIVNVSSACGLTPTNYPELTALDEKYRDQGLQILAFPCNQFAGQMTGRKADYSSVQRASFGSPSLKPHVHRLVRSYGLQGIIQVRRARAVLKWLVAVL